MEKIQGIRVLPAKTVEQAVRGSDVVVTVTPSREPLVRAEWVLPGTHITAVGADSPDKQELDVQVLEKADKVVADHLDQCIRLGEIHHAVEAGVFRPADVYAELGEIAAGRKPGRTSDAEITVADLTGVGVQDAALAELVVVGFGNVGREFARLLLERRSELTRAFGLDASIVAILTARHGSVENPLGIDLRKALRLADAGVSLESCGRGISRTAPEYIRQARADIVIELTPLRIGPRQIAVEHGLAALQFGKHLITANKGPVVYHYRRLRELARQNRVGFRYEGTVMDGAPVFNLFQEALRGARIESFECILNSTTNLVLSEIEAGRTYANGVEAARRIGFLETDPSMDLDGWDATMKACLLANVLMGGRLRPERVPRQRVSTMPADAVRDAITGGKRMKQIARGWREGRTVKASVSMEAIGPDHPLFSVNGTSSSLVVRTDMLKEFQIVERDPGLRQTAFAVYSDLIAIHGGRLTP